MASPCPPPLRHTASYQSLYAVMTQQQSVSFSLWFTLFSREYFLLSSNSQKIRFLHLLRALEHTALLS